MDFTGKKYIYADGRRKTSVAQVRLYAGGTGTVVINSKAMKEFVSDPYLIDVVTYPLKLIGGLKSFDVSIRVVGGGKSGQAEACRYGIAKALLVNDESLKSTLKDAGLLSRDARVVERKKPGLKKARKSSQWAKR